MARLFFLTVVEGKDYEEKSRGNRIKVLFEPALRGVVFDQGGEILVRNTSEGRKYLYDKVLAHVLGYLGETTEKGLGNQSQECLDLLKQGRYLPGCLMMGDLTGKAGLEKQYDNMLRGQKAEKLAEVDSAGEIIREMGYKPAIAGKNLKLWLDLSLQQKAYEALGEKIGAVIVSRPNGEVLALVSKPSFDPNLFTIKNDSSDFNKLFLDESQPMFNRSLAGLYPPGSTFKLVTSMAGLEGDYITLQTEFEDVGNLCFGEWCFGNWYYLQYGRKEGMVNLTKALKRSNDIYFYELGRLLGIKALSDWAKNFGFTQATGIDLPGEEKGLFPNAQWKEEYKGEGWYLGDTLITSIGQGDILATPIQVQQMTNTIANKGVLCPSQILDSTQKNETSEWEKYEKGECRDLGVSENNLSYIIEGMKQACSPGGTGWPLFNFGIGGESSASASFKKIETACKTGTAEFGDPDDRTHAWFTIFAPINDPEIVVTVLAEKAGEGSDQAAPIAKEILKHYFENKN